jgi:signal transduction histidine kinase
MPDRGRLKTLFSRHRIWIYVLALIIISVLHYSHPNIWFLKAFPLTRRAAGRILFILPVAGVTFILGQLGGLITLIVAILIMLPRVFFISSSPADALLEVAAVAFIGLFVVLVLEWHRRNVFRLRVINAVTRALSESLEPAKFLNDVLDTLVKVLAVEAGAVFLVDGHEQGLTLVAHRNLPRELFEGVSGLQAARRLARHEGLRYRLAVPLGSKDQINGLVIVGNRRPRSSLSRERELVTTVCSQTNVAIEKARLYQDMTRQLQVERSVCDVVDQITSELELDRVLTKVIAIAESLAGADSGVIALWDKERDAVTYPYIHNLHPKLAQVIVSVEEGLSAEVMMVGRPIIIADYARYERAIPAFVDAGVKSIVGVPIVNRDRIFGAMCVMSIKRTKSFLDRDVAILTEIGRQAGIAVENSYLYENLRYYARRIMQAQESERKRIARELHDDTIQSLIALSRRLEGLVTSDEQLPETASRRIRDLWQQTDDMIHRVRQFSHNLRPSLLDDLGLLPTLEELTADMNRQAGLRAEFRVLGERRRLSSEVELTLFRIIQEALSNVRRHSKATEVTTTVELTNSIVRVTVQDNGIGFRSPTLASDLRAEDGLGLIGMHERARLLGGDLVIDSEPGRGTRVIAEVPV